MKVTIEINNIYDKIEVSHAIDYLETLLNKKEINSFLDKRVDDVFEKERTLNCLLSDKIFTIRDVIDRIHDLCRIPNMGRKSLMDVSETLTKNGIECLYGRFYEGYLKIT